MTASWHVWLACDGAVHRWFGVVRHHAHAVAAGCTGAIVAGGVVFASGPSPGGLSPEPARWPLADAGTYELPDLAPYGVQSGAGAGLRFGFSNAPAEGSAGPAAGGSPAPYVIDYAAPYVPATPGVPTPVPEASSLAVMGMAVALLAGVRVWR